MPITIGSLNNVPAPGDPITSPWAQAITPLGVHRFASLSALNAQWATAPDGAMAVTVDNFATYIRRAGAWSRLFDAGFVGAVNFGTGQGSCPHNLGRLPVSAVVTIGQALNITAQVQGVTTSVITIRAITIAATPATFTGTSNIFYFVA